MGETNKSTRRKKNQDHEVVANPHLWSISTKRGLGKNAPSRKSNINSTAGEARAAAAAARPSNAGLSQGLPEKFSSPSRTTPPRPQSRGLSMGFPSDKFGRRQQPAHAQAQRQDHHDDGHSSSDCSDPPVHEDPYPAHLVTATLVQQDDADADNNDNDNQVVETVVVAHPTRWKDYLCHRSVLAITGSLMVTLVILIVVIVVVSNTGDTATPTVAPTSFPTASPTISLPSLLPDYSLQAITDDPEGPQAKALEWVEASSTSSLMSDRRKLQRFALATLFFATQGPQWNPVIRRQWLEDTVHECEWGSSFLQKNQSLSCNFEGYYERLDLVQGNLRGTLPPELGLLTDLAVLNVQDNALTGTIPTQLTTVLSKLEFLELKINAFRGTLPTGLADLTQLTHLSLETNQFTGTIPPRLFQQLTQLSLLRLAANQLFGTLPTEIEQLSLLEQLVLPENSLSGTLPSQIGMASQLISLSVSNNRFHGPVFSELGQLTRLQGLRLSRNNLSGSLPVSSLVNLTQLDWLWVFDNDLLTGTIPAEMCSWEWHPTNGLLVDCERIQCMCEACVCL